MIIFNCLLVKIPGNLQIQQNCKLYHKLTFSKLFQFFVYFLDIPYIYWDTEFFLFLIFQRLLLNKFHHSKFWKFENFKDLKIWQFSPHSFKLDSLLISFQSSRINGELRAFSNLLLRTSKPTGALQTCCEYITKYQGDLLQKR